MDTRKFRKSRYIKSTDVDGGRTTVTITDVDTELSKASGDDVLIAKFAEFPDKVLTLNPTAIDSLTNIAGDFDSDSWVGLRVELYTVPEPMARTGEAVRIRKAKEAPARGPAAAPADLNDSIPF